MTAATLSAAELMAQADSVRSVFQSGVSSLAVHVLPLCPDQEIPSQGILCGADRKIFHAIDDCRVNVLNATVCLRHYLRAIDQVIWLLNIWCHFHRARASPKLCLASSRALYLSRSWQAFITSHGQASSCPPEGATQVYRGEPSR